MSDSSGHKVPFHHLGNIKEVDADEKVASKRKDAVPIAHDKMVSNLRKLKPSEGKNSHAKSNKSTATNYHKMADKDVQNTNTKSKVFRGAGTSKNVEMVSNSTQNSRTYALEESGAKTKVTSEKTSKHKYKNKDIHGSSKDVACLKQDVSRSNEDVPSSPSDIIVYEAGDGVYLYSKEGKRNARKNSWTRVKEFMTTKKSDKYKKDEKRYPLYQVSEHGKCFEHKKIFLCDLDVNLNVPKDHMVDINKLPQDDSAKLVVLRCFETIPEDDIELSRSGVFCCSALEDIPEPSKVQTRRKFTR
ncbi:uncharacterized protein LOC130644556 [Hydractinia symbiolongicarpus]|uniref:uncharacterized protein LOC130644556 n=1 Tax=Hydractinia symbiolongicarpus TaxID=13093 RepID=UPI002551A52A|nr:uncharacterized protein LOC130644556 [Hydractinia symbiolongicarpus]